jgi:hypothetical protein
MGKSSFQNVSHKLKKNENGNQYEELFFETVDSQKLTLKVCKSFLFFENNSAFIIECSGEKFKFKSDLLDDLIKTARFFKPILGDFDPSETSKYDNENFGFEFKYPKYWKIKDELSDETPKITFSKQGSDTYGKITVSPFDSDLQSILNKIKKIKQFSQGQWDSQNVQHYSKTNSYGFKYECIEYDLVDPFDSTKIFEKVNQNYFFEGNFQYLVQTIGPPNDFDYYFMDEITDGINFKSPIKKIDTQKYKEDKFGIEFQYPSSLIIKPSQGTIMQLQIYSEISTTQPVGLKILNFNSKE